MEYSVTVLKNINTMILLFALFGPVRAVSGIAALQAKYAAEAKTASAATVPAVNFALAEQSSPLAAVQPVVVQSPLAAMQTPLASAAAAAAPAAAAQPGSKGNPEPWFVALNEPRSGASAAQRDVRVPLPASLGPQRTGGGVGVVLVNAPGVAKSGGPRCLDHFGSRFPMATGLVAVETDVWSCAEWIVDLPLVRSGRFGRLCLTRVAAGWGGPGAKQGVVARPCALATATPIAEQQWTQNGAAFVAAGGLGAGECLTAPADPCRRKMSTSADLAPCGGALAALQSWAAAPLATPTPAELLASSDLAATLAACAARDQATFAALAKKNHADAVNLVKTMDHPTKPRLLVNGVSKLCLQPRRSMDGSIRITTHRCIGMKWDLKIGEAAAKLSKKAKFDATHYPPTIPATEWVFKRDARKKNTEYGVLHLQHTPKDGKGRFYPKLTECLTCADCHGHGGETRLTLTPCNGSNVQMWLFDFNHIPATYTLRPKLRKDDCVAASTAGQDGYGRTVYIRPCVSGDPLQRWGPRRLEIENHAPTATLSEAYGAEKLPKHIVETETKIAEAFPKEWLAFRSFQDVYDPVPTPYNAWLAKQAKAGAFGEVGKAHIDQFRVKKMMNNMTEGRPFKNIFSMALFIPAPVTPELVPLFGPVLDVDKKFAELTKKMTELFAKNDIEEVRRSTFYQRYMIKMISCINFIRVRLPEWSARVHLSPKLEPLAADILAAGNVQVAIMADPSIRTAGAFWRWISFDDTSLDTVIACDSDEADGNFGGTILANLWSGVEHWRKQGATEGHAFFRWFAGWTDLARATNSRGVQYSPIQANVVMTKPKLLTWSIMDSMVGFSIARVPRVWERRFYPHGETRVHQFSRVFDRDPMETERGTRLAGPYFANLGWGRRYQEYGYDEAWTKHVLYWRSLAEGMLYSYMPLRNKESEIGPDLIYSGPTRSDANAVLRCANAWFLDGVEAARFPGNAMLSTDGFGTCDSHSTGQVTRFKPCGAAVGAEHLHQKWKLSAEGCLRSVAVGQEEGSCVTIPTQRMFRGLHASGKHVPAINQYCESFCGSESGSERIIGRSFRQVFDFVASATASNSGTVQVKFGYKAHDGQTDAPKQCLTLHRANGMVAVVACDSSNANQVWKFDPLTNTVSVDAGALCLSMDNCGAVPIDFTPLAAMCDSTAVEEMVAKTAQMLLPAVPVVASAASAADPGLMSLIPPPSSSDASMLASLEKAQTVIGWWLANFGVRTKAEVSAMPFHDIRSTFFAEVTGGPRHKGLLRPWTDTIDGYGPQVPIQRCDLQQRVLRCDFIVLTLLLLLLLLCIHLSPSLSAVFLDCFLCWSASGRRVLSF